LTIKATFCGDLPNRLLLLGYALAARRSELLALDVADLRGMP
jgi:hypothetical protein